MKTNEAIKDYKELTYDFAKHLDKLAYIKDRVEYINHEMNWDGMFEIDFDKAMTYLAKVQAAMVLYTMESDFRERDIRQYEQEAKALRDSRI